MRTVNRENLRDITYRSVFSNDKIEKPFTYVQLPKFRLQSGNYFPSIDNPANRSLTGWLAALRSISQ